MAADQNLALMAALMAAGAAILAGFFAWIRSREHAGKEALLSTSLFHNRTSNLALVTQNVQWAMLLGTSFVVSAYLQVVRHYDAIQTGVIFTAATVGILLSSLAAGRLARRFRQRTLILAGFVITIAGIIVLLSLVKGHPGAWYFAPGLFLIGVGLGVMLTPSVDVVQSAFPEDLQGEISGVSRSVSNLGSSLGTAIAATILVIGPNQSSRNRHDRPRPHRPDRPRRDHLAGRRSRTSASVPALQPNTAPGPTGSRGAPRPGAAGHGRSGEAGSRPACRLMTIHPRIRVRLRGIR